MSNKKREIVSPRSRSVFLDIICKKKNPKWHDETAIILGYLKNIVISCVTRLEIKHIFANVSSLGWPLTSY